MKKILPLFFFLFCLGYTMDTQSTQTNQEQTVDEQTSQDALSRFAPAQVNSPYYASFGVNLTYTNFTHSQYFNTHSFNSLIFTLDMGWILNEENPKSFIGLYLDGAVGGGKSNALYGLFSGIKAGWRLWDGRVIPFIKLGAKLMHFPFEHQNEQFNAVGLDAEIGAFFDVAKGYGINLSYRYGYDYAYKFKLKNIHTSIVMLGFNYHDFSLDW